MSKKVNKKEITYSRNGDYLVPDLVIDNGKIRPKLGKYGRLRLKFLKEEMKAEYTKMLMNNTLTDYLLEVDAKATDMENMLINELKKRSKIDEKLKETNQMEWVGRMNNIKNRAEEIILNEIIYR